jgi:hypothetical protein
MKIFPVLLILVFMTESPVQARFLQADAVGYTDDLNMYEYVRDDPTNLTDPRGLSAFVDVNDDTEVNITVPMYVVGGDAASDANVALIARNIGTVWTGNFGRYHVTTNVQILTRAQSQSSQIVNTLYVLGGATKNLDHGVSYDLTDYQTNTGEDIYISMRDVRGEVHEGVEASKMGNTPAHECGHCMGLHDVAGDAGGNIMDGSHGANVAEGDITNIINSPINVVTRHAGGQGTSHWDISNGQVTGQRCDGRVGPNSCN